MKRKVSDPGPSTVTADEENKSGPPKKKERESSVPKKVAMTGGPAEVAFINEDAPAKFDWDKYLADLDAAARPPSSPSPPSSQSTAWEILQWSDPVRPRPKVIEPDLTVNPRALRKPHQPSRAIANWRTMFRRLRNPLSILPTFGQSHLKLFNRRLISTTDDGCLVELTVAEPPNSNSTNPNERKIPETLRKWAEAKPLNVFFPTTTAAERVSLIAGFDNTGNVRLWPGGEALAFFLMFFKQWHRDLKVLELGCGLAALPSLVASQYAASVRCSDGNEMAVANVRKNLSISEPGRYSNITVRHQTWNPGGKPEYDLIMAADCVFFEKTHKQLLDCVYPKLKPEGRFLVCSPQRKGSLNVFLKNVREDGRFRWRWCHEWSPYIGEYEPGKMSEEDKDLYLPLLYVLEKKIVEVKPKENPE